MAVNQLRINCTALPSASTLVFRSTAATSGSISPLNACSAMIPRAMLASAFAFSASAAIICASMAILPPASATSSATSSAETGKRRARSRQRA